jgi:hypothetical protein
MIVAAGVNAGNVPVSIGIAVTENRFHVLPPFGNNTGYFEVSQLATALV